MSEWKYVGQMGVDAGLCWVGDPCYIMHKEPGEGYPELGLNWHDFCDKLQLNEPNNNLHSFGNIGCCVSTGYGDGTYPVVARVNDEGLVAEVRAIFVMDGLDFKIKRVLKEAGVWEDKDEDDNW